MLRNRAKRKYGTVAQEIQFSEFYRTAIFQNEGISDGNISSTYKRNRGGKIDYAKTHEKSGGSFSSSFWFNYH